ncbi:hypothetical protein HV560_06880 [Mannheimia pernigra]|uniref:Apea-like HEPN domain-containing protein n=1 Tax=Mannheimia pernigra TaxID=111844 RepID=A0ABD7A9I2_9PAST|nr:hypothetical protein [Mannheimia pernigra]QLB42557.1 hypothetical protein HV560_06880 [Mannheimia pernigra]
MKEKVLELLNENSQQQTDECLYYLYLHLSDTLENQGVDTLFNEVEFFIEEKNVNIFLDELKYLDYHLSQLSEKDLSYFITKCFLKNQTIYYRFASDILSYNKGIETEFDFSLIPDNTDLHFLAKKCIGWLLPNSSKSSIPITLSLLNKSEDNIQNEIINLLYDFAFMAYPMSSIEYFRKFKKSTKGKLNKKLKELIYRCEEYDKLLDLAIESKEFSPSNENRHIYNIKKHTCFTQAYEKSENNSIFSKIATKITILHGSETIHHMKNGSNINRNISPFSSIKTEFEIFRLSLLNPVETEKILFLFRIEGISE